MTRARELADGKHLTNVDSNTLVVDATNNRVGIGTASPSAGLTLEGTKDTLASQLKVTATGVVSQYLGGGDNVGLAIGHDHASLPIVFKTGVTAGTGVTGSGTERMRIDGTGVGIGEASPAAPLHISTAASTTAELRLTSNNTGSGSGDRGRIAVYSSRNDGTAYEAGRIDIDRSSGTEDKAHIQFFTNDGSGASERLRILSGGGLTFNGDTAAANALDDYEEGTYTPAFTSTGASFSYSVQLGSYVKIGQLVCCWFNITLSASPSGTTSNQLTFNVPFATNNVDNSLYSGGHIGHYFNINLGSGTTIAYQLPSASSTQIELKEVGDNIGENGIVASELNTSAVIRGSVMYRAAS